MPIEVEIPSPFALPAPRKLRAVGRWGAAALERLLGLRELARVYQRVRAGSSQMSFARRSLAELGVSVSCSAADLSRIPREGPLVIVANHPFGALDGLILLDLLQRVRPDVRILANYLLGRIPELREASCFVDPFGGGAAARRNLGPTRAALRWVEQGHALCVLPAGEVSSLSLRAMRVRDPQWRPTAARILRRSGATCVPIFVAGRNSAVFQAAGLIHARLRTVLLPAELLRGRRRRVRVCIGNPIDAASLRRHADDAALTAYLRMRTNLLAIRAEDAPSRAPAILSSGVRGAAIEVAAPIHALERDLSSLPGERRLATGGGLGVWLARAAEIPNLLREIGRQREIAFRAAGEGSGLACDLDRFDADYLHLFVWDEAQRAVAGAYRLGPTDEILPRSGVLGLYTHTLFRFDPRLLERLGPALELGRSFVAERYQRSFAPLMLLWKGIGAYVAANPRYRHLFGAVSISNEYRSTTRELLMRWLRANDFRADLAQLARARTPPRRLGRRLADVELSAATIASAADVDQLVREIEGDGRPMPVLLRQYLRLNGKLLGFNVDAKFGNVLDGLILVDLLDVERAVLERYMGAAAAGGLHALHGASHARLR